MASACQLACFPEGLTHLTIGNSLNTKVPQTQLPTSIPCSARRWLSFGNGGQCGELGKEILTAQVPEQEHDADEVTPRPQLLVNRQHKMAGHATTMRSSQLPADRQLSPMFHDATPTRLIRTVFKRLEPLPHAPYDPFVIASILDSRCS